MKLSKAIDTTATGASQVRRFARCWLYRLLIENYDARVFVLIDADFETLKKIQNSTHFYKTCI